MQRIPKKTLVLLKLILILSVAGQVTMSGCLSPDQQAVVNKLEHRKGKILDAVQSIDAEIALVRTAIQNKEYTIEGGKKIIAGLVDKKGTLLGSVSGVVGEIAEAQAANVPWWAYIPSILGLIAGTASTVMGVRGTGKANALSLATGASFGALSRGLDVGLSKLDKNIADNVRADIMASANKTPGTSPDELRVLHHKSIVSDNPVAA